MWRGLGKGVEILENDIYACCLLTRLSESVSFMNHNSSQFECGPEASMDSVWNKCSAQRNPVNPENLRPPVSTTCSKRVNCFNT